MRIQELENRVSIERATIRFYEKEGLIHPARSENGYRDYSEDDVQELKKIKLLRELGITLEDIRALQSGAEDFDAVMERQANILRSRERQMSRAAAVCDSLKGRGMTYGSLNTAHCQSMLKAPALPGSSEPKGTPETVYSEPVNREMHPFRRYFARMLDHYLLDAVLTLLAVTVLGWRSGDTVLFTILGYLVWWIRIPVNAAFLHFFGTTPGKLVMGIRIEDISQGKMDFESAMRREFQVLGWGQGFGIPLVSLIMMGRCLYLSLKYGPDAISWDDEVNLTYPRWDWKRKLMIPCVVGIGILIEFAGIYMQIMPISSNKHPQISEFAGNFNMYDDLYNNDGCSELQANGEFASAGAIVTSTLPDGKRVTYPMRGEFTYETVDGCIASLSFEHMIYGRLWVTENEPKTPTGMTMDNECVVAMIAIGASQPGMSPKDINDFAAALNEKLLEDASQGVTWVYGDVTYFWRVSMAQVSEPESNGQIKSAYYQINAEMEITIN